jgi:aspartate ammonia-lyase
MNVNEVIANRANEILGGNKGEYMLAHPHNHVNMSQSSNDVIPTGIRLACLLVSNPLIAEMKALERAFAQKSKEYADLLSCGRTHLQDAVPISYGQVFGAYATAIRKDREALEISLEELRELGIGGTAVGTGITAHPKFKDKAIYYMSKNTGLKLRVADDSVQTTSDMNCFLRFSSALRAYATTLNRIANDLRLLASGPKTAIAEIILPEIEPGSSIMPGKVNPSVPEAVNQVCFQVMGNCHAIELAANGGQLQLNFFTPLIGNNLIVSSELLTNCSKMFNAKCVSGLKVDGKRVKENLENSFAFATALNPYLGYSAVSKLVAEAYQKGVPLKKLILEKGLVDEKDLDKILSPAFAAGPSEVDKVLLERLKSRRR